MEIKSSLQKLADPYAAATKAANKHQQQTTKAESVPTQDHVTVSSEARLTAVVHSAATATPEMRNEKIEALKVRLAEGTYEPNSEDIASKMLKEDQHLASTLKP